MVTATHPSVPREATHKSYGVSPHDVEADIYYTKPSSNNGTPVTIDQIQGHEPEFLETRKLLIKDVRPNLSNFTLDRNGFQYLTHAVPAEHLASEDAIKTQHFPELESFLIKATGAKWILIFNHVVRNAPWIPAESKKPSYVGPAHRCHIDLSIPYAKTVITQHLHRFNKADQVDTVLAGKWQLLNVWRPLKTIHRSPLAVADSTTIPRSDQIDLKYERKFIVGGEERKLDVENNFTMAPSNEGEGKKHQFYYMYEQKPDEVVIFKTGESDESLAAGPVTHTAFEVPGTEHLPTRENIEVRVLAVY